MKLIELYNVEKLFEKSGLSVEDFNVIVSITNDPLSSALAKFSIIHKLPIDRFPSEFKNQVSFLKDLCNAEIFMSTKTEEEIVEVYYGIEMKTHPTFYDLITKYNKFPAHKYISTQRDEIKILLLKSRKLRALKRFFTNLGVVFYSELLTNITQPGQLIETTAHSWRKEYDELVLDGILRIGEEKDLPLILNYKTKNELIKILEKVNMESNFSSKSKTQLIDELLKIDDVRKIEVQKKFYLLSDPFQELKNWIQWENVYRKLYYVLNDTLGSYVLIPDVLKELIERNQDYKTAEYLIQMFLNNLSMFSNINQFTVDKIARQYKKIKKKNNDYHNKHLFE